MIEPVTRDVRDEANFAVRKKDVHHQNQIYYWGYLILAISLLFYLFIEYVDEGGNTDELTLFFVHYFLALTYTGMLIYHKSLGVVKSWSARHIHKTVILLNTFLISCYALNRELPVFQESTTWFCVYLVICSLATLSARFSSKLPGGINKTIQILLGSALVLYLYMALYIAKYYALGGIGILALGIGGHVLVPLFLLISTISLLVLLRVKTSRGWMLSGAAGTFLVVVVFMQQWNARISDVERLTNQSVLNPETELPVWVRVAQSVKNDWITERILKSNLVYTVVNPDRSWDLFPARSTWSEEQKHDPLVYLASLTRRTSLGAEDRISILKAISDNRHHAEDRLWSGDNLVTSYVVTDADIFSELRLAYTEHYFNIRYDNRRENRWASPEEAIYTFQLPEGSVVTSLSLWINGKEEKGILTSKQKASEAYNTIVGKEQRDPSIVQWQEGNTVTVRIFPCTPSEERKFKIGITSPLVEENGKVYYRGLTFRGPTPANADQTVRLRILGSPSDLDLPRSFHKNEKGEYIAEHNYNPDFQVSFAVQPIRINEFSFDGFTYSMAGYVPQMQKVNFETIFLDINETWSRDEIDQLKEQTAKRVVYTRVDGEFIQLNESNWKDLTNRLLQDNFSIFPFHLITDPEHSLVITKGKQLSPFLVDFKDSNFANGVTKFFRSGNRAYVFNITSSVSTYIRSLKELRGLQFATGNVSELMAVLEKNEFPIAAESESQLVLHEAKAVITKKPVSETVKPNTAPDHLARLFAYNNIMRQVGSSYFDHNFVNEKLVDEAKSAYVVSPVSSLIVLETKNDYERFGIADNANSLGNAAKQSSGAVPEPHEWALIISFLVLIVYCLARLKQQRSTVSL